MTDDLEQTFKEWLTNGREIHLFSKNVLSQKKNCKT